MQQAKVRCGLLRETCRAEGEGPFDSGGVSENADCVWLSSLTGVNGIGFVAFL